MARRYYRRSRRSYRRARTVYTRGRRYFGRQRKAIRLNKSIGYWAPAMVGMATNFNVPEDVTDLLAVMPVSGGIAGQIKNVAQGYRFGKLVNKRVLKGRISIGGTGTVNTII